jgi:hypothetical protein
MMEEVVVIASEDDDEIFCFKRLQTNNAFRVDVTDLIQP